MTETGNRLFDFDELRLPCHSAADRSTVNVFNPSVFDADGDRIMAYRVVGPNMRRHMALCRIDAGGAIDRGSVVCLSDHIRFATACDAHTRDWHAEPRLFLYRDRLYCHFNNGVPPHGDNRIFIVELNRDTLCPAGIAREVVKLDGRCRTEKNWLFFEHHGELYALYSLQPKILLTVDLSARTVVTARTGDRAAWDASAYERRYGVLRGGATPILDGDRYWVTFHSQYQDVDARVAGNCSGPADRCKYVGGLLALGRQPPFPVLGYTNEPILRLSPSETLLKVPRVLNARCSEIAYPCGMTANGGRFGISYGINDGFAALKTFELDAGDMASSATNK